MGYNADDARRIEAIDQRTFGHRPNMGGQPIHRDTCPQCGKRIVWIDYTTIDGATGKPFTPRVCVHLAQR